MTQTFSLSPSGPSPIWRCPIPTENVSIHWAGFRVVKAAPGLDNLKTGVQLSAVQPKKFHTSKKQGTTPVDFSKIPLLGHIQNFVEAFERELSAVQIGNSTLEYEILQDFIHCTTLATFGREHQRRMTGLKQIPQRWLQLYKTSTEEPADAQSNQKQGSTDC